jgi:hypothetical protein
MDGACIWLVTASAVLEILLSAESCLAMANLTALMDGVFVELAKSRFASRTLAMGSGLVSGTPLPMIDAEAPVSMAMAELLTAA